MSNDIPPIVSNIFVSDAGQVKVEYFDGLVMRFELECKNLDPDLAAEKLNGYCQTMWPWVKRCTDAGEFKATLPSFKIEL